MMEAQARDLDKASSLFERRPYCFRLDSKLPSRVLKSVETEKLWEACCLENTENPEVAWLKRKLPPASCG